jgi:glutaredoxin
LDRFERVNTQVLGISIDSKDSLKAWAESLGGVTYPLLADFWPHGAVAQKFGVLRSEGYSERAIFIIDRTGIICYVDVHDIDDQPDNELLFRELAAMEGVPIPQEIIGSAPAQPSAPEPAATPQAAAAAQIAAGEGISVTMYCTDWCPACRRARAYLKINNVPFTEVNIARDRQAAAEVRSWTGGYESTPAFNVNGTVVINFDVEKLNKLLGIEG